MLDGGDTETAFQELPYYKAILKSFFRRQIQHLLEELAQQTGEESIILTADVNNGTLSQLGSSTGRGFLDGRDEIKTQFLSYCLKRYHGQMTPESPSLYQQTFAGHVNNLDHLQPPPPKRHKAHNASLPRLTLHDQTRAPIQRIPESTATGVPSLDMVMGGNSDLAQGVTSLGNTPVSSVGGAVCENTMKKTKKEFAIERKATIVKEEKDAKQHDDGCWQTADGDTNGPTVTAASSADDNETKSPTETSDNDSNQFPANGVVNVGNDSNDIVKVEPGYDEDQDPEMAGTDMLPPDFGLFQQGQQGNYTALMGNDPDMFLTQSGRHIGTLSHTSSDPPIRSSNMWNQMFNQSSQPSQYVQCVLCNKLLSQASFRGHMLSHRGVRNFECEYCHKRFTHKATLLNHRRLHTGERPFRCTVCNVGFPSLSGLSQHKFSRHRSKEFSRIDPLALMNQHGTDMASLTQQMGLTDETMATDSLTGIPE